MANCYYCEQPITGLNKSSEHVIPDFLGGTITSLNLLCRACNSRLGRTIDSSLHRQLQPYADLLVTVRDRTKTNTKVKLVNSQGEELFVGKNLKPYSKLYIVHKTGEKTIHVRNEDFDKLMHRKIQEMGGVEKVNKREFSEPPPIDKFHIQNEMTTKPGIVGFGGKDYFKAIAKIAVNYALYNNFTTTQISYALSFLKTDHSINNTVGFFNPSNYPPHDYHKNEVANILYLRGDSELKILYCYVELLSFQCLLVVLNQNYTDADFDATYSFDVLSQQIISKAIKIGIGRHHFEILRFLSLGQKNTEEWKLNRITSIIENLQ